jgi:tripartite-type tricarboxylate transporter receptor subunit TctC
MIVRALLAGLIGATLLGTGTAQAQTYPAKPVKIIVGFAAGGLADMMARLFGDFITRETGQPVVVENRSGAAGTIGLDAVAKSAPDGYTLGVVISGVLVVNPFVQKQMPFDAMKDVMPVAALVDAPQLIAISTEVPAKTAQEFIALVKAKPKGYSYGSAGRGSFPHLSAAAFAHAAGVDMVHVPYRGNAPAITDLMAGRVQMVSSSIASLQPGIDAGKIRVVLAATKQRLSYLKDVPTSAEAGLTDYLMSAWVGVVAPAGTPKDVAARIHQLADSMLADPATVKRVEGASLEPMRMTQPAFADFVKAEYAKSGRIVKEAGVEAQ